MGVFAALTLSQAGMVVHWRRLREEKPTWRRSAMVNGIGATTTFIVLGIVFQTKFLEGGWMVVVAVPILVVAMNAIHRHYMGVRVQLRDPTRRPRQAEANHVVMLVGGPSEEERRAFWYSEQIRTSDFHAVHFAERNDPRGLEAMWARELGILPTTPLLETLPMQGSLASSVRGYVARLRSRIPADDFVTVIVSERVKQGLVRRGTGRGFLLKLSLLFAPDVVVTNVPHVEGSMQEEALDKGSAIRHIVIVLVAAAHNASLTALEYAKTLSADAIRAVHVVLDPEMSDHHEAEWEALDTGFPLEFIDAPYRELGQTLREYVRPISLDGSTIVTVVLPEFVVRRWWHHLLHNQNAFDVKWTFLAEPDVMVTSVPYHLE
ncbi:MAG: hypothetical protein WD826_07650 [Actinomycetota bacterium]